MKREPSHLDIETPLFHGKPHIWIQWKGTKVCCDVYCKCGASFHFDGSFFYYFKCPGCKKVYEVGTHVNIYPVSEDRDMSSISVHGIED